MIRTTSHEQASELLAAAALDSLPSDEQDAVLAHAASCPVCGPELQALRDTFAEMAVASPPVSADGERRIARTRGRLLARVSRRPSSMTWVPLALAAGVAGVAILGRDVGKLSSELAATRDSVSHMRTMTGQLAARDRMLDRLTGPETVVYSLTANQQPASSALLFWNRQTNAWTMYARHMNMPAPGKMYELWLVTANAKIPAGTFMPSPAGMATVQATYALDRNALRAVAVTEEPEPGVQQPTGPIVMTGPAGSG